MIDMRPEINFKKSTRQYSGVFGEPGDAVQIHPATEAHQLGFWSFTVTEIFSEKGFWSGFDVYLSSVRSETTCRSRFSEHYHHPGLYNRLSLGHVPLHVIEAICSAVPVEGLMDAYVAACEALEAEKKDAAV